MYIQLNLGSRTNFPNTKRLGWLLCLELQTRKPSTLWGDKLGVSVSAVFVEEWSTSSSTMTNIPIIPASVTNATILPVRICSPNISIISLLHKIHNFSGFHLIQLCSSNKTQFKTLYNQIKTQLTQDAEFKRIMTGKCYSCRGYAMECDVLTNQMYASSRMYF
jgi:hypothetical protein